LSQASSQALHLSAKGGDDGGEHEEKEDEEEEEPFFDPAFSPTAGFFRRSLNMLRAIAVASANNATTGIVIPTFCSTSLSSAFP
jgi:hypothetical protein